MEEPEVLKPEERDIGALVVSIVTTLLWGVAFGFFLNYFVYQESLIFLGESKNLLIHVILPAVIYTMIHPVIGKFWGWIIENLCNVIDSTYGIQGKNRWGNWPREKKMSFACWWPILAPLGLIFYGIGVFFGLLFRRLYP